MSGLSSEEDDHISPKRQKLTKSEDTLAKLSHIDWKKLKQKKREEKRKWKEQKLLRKLERAKQQEVEESSKKEQEEEKERLKKVFGRSYSLSIALPGSILDNAQSPELRTYLAGQIARAAAVFNVDEIIIFDETGSINRSTEGEFHGVGKKGNANVQIARILQYLECPQYLRKCLFPQHKDLQYAGVLNPLDTPHHMKASDTCEYREGVVLDKPCKPGKGSYVNVGLLKEVQLDKQLQPGLRVTVKLNSSSPNKKLLKGQAVPPSEPSMYAGLYWGYSVRLARSLGAVFTECPYKDGYDLTIGTSDKGENVDEFVMSDFSHGLVVFGGLKGLEASLEADEALDVEDPSLLFHHYLNTCPKQGSGTIRTEEAILITMSALRPKLPQPQKSSPS
ncbi:putative methyltransferase C9orf114 [Liolophura sinensis]|uniref:putative methyltransferase C9orf114 n=1 Tax=Liolophura sinensis TaxID=3198878 RepID=UPI003158B326